MKKWFALVLVLIFVHSIAFADSVESIDTYGNLCSILTSENKSVYDVSPASLPYSIPYNGKEIRVTFCGYYQLNADHGYYPFLHIIFDVSQISEDEMYWFLKDDVRFSASCHPLDNLNETFVLSESEIEYDEWIGVAQVLLYGTDVSRYSFENHQIFADIEINFPKGTIVSFDSEDVAVNTISVHLTNGDAPPMDLNESPYGIIKRVKEQFLDN